VDVVPNIDLMTGRQAGRLTPHVLTEMTGSVAGNDDAGFNGRSFRPVDITRDLLEPKEYRPSEPTLSNDNSI
jgi:hypothetical protein